MLPVYSANNRVVVMNKGSFREYIVLKEDNGVGIVFDEDSTQATVTLGQKHYDKSTADFIEFRETDEVSILIDPRKEGEAQIAGFIVSDRSAGDRAAAVFFA